MKAIRLENSNLLIPKRAETEDGVIGDGMVEVEPGGPEYEEWKAYAEPDEVAENSSTN